MQEAFDNEKAVIWDKYQETAQDNRRLQHRVDLSHHDVEDCRHAVDRVVAEYQPIHQLIHELTSDTQALLASYGQNVSIGRTASSLSKKDGREIVPLRGVPHPVDAGEGQGNGRAKCVRVGTCTCQ